VVDNLLVLIQAGAFHPSQSDPRQEYVCRDWGRAQRD